MFLAQCTYFLCTGMWNIVINNLKILKRCQFVVISMLLLSSIYKKMDPYIEFQINYRSRRKNTKQNQLFIS